MSEVAKTSILKLGLPTPIRLPSQLVTALAVGRYRGSDLVLGDKKQSKLGAMFGWFSSDCPGYPETVGLKCHVLAQDDNQRPLIDLEPNDHPLAVDQRDGITFERALELARPWLRVMGHTV